VIIATLMGLMVFRHAAWPATMSAQGADWGGRLLIGTGVSMIYAGLEQGTASTGWNPEP